VLVQPATVDRWHREGFYRYWRRRSRHPGRPRIDSESRGLIRRLAGENHLWGAPRIHGELLKLGIDVSERTVSRYLAERLRVPSQTWRTFLANHFGQFAFVSPETSSYALGANDVLDLSGQTFRHTALSRDGLCASHQCAVVERASLQQTSPGKEILQDHLHGCITIRTGSGRGPPTHRRFGRPTVCPGRVDGAPAPNRCDERRSSDDLVPARLAIVVNVVERRYTFVRAPVHLRVGDLHFGRNIGEAQPSSATVYVIISARVRESASTSAPRDSVVHRS